ncbi:MAG: dUTP diphosphatase, partial [Hyphomicrobiales bacterium]|nr:dUTP diphosphatase [Hyphomicrobiales bacterium]
MTHAAPLIGIVRLPHNTDLTLPAYETAGAAGMDLRAAVPEDRPLLILPGRRALVPTGLVMEIPEGFEGQVRPRSG